MSTARITNWTTAADGRITVTWGDGSSSEFLNLAEIKARIANMESRELTENTLFAWFLARQPDASSTNIIVGKTLTLDYSAANPIRVQ